MIQNPKRPAYVSSRTEDRDGTLHVMNVLFDDRFGGATKRVVQVAAGLREKGVRTTVCLPEGGGNAEDLARGAGIPVARLSFGRIPPPRDPRRVLRWSLRLPRDVRRFLKLFRREQPDVVHVNGAFFIAPAVAARLAGIPLVWHLNDTLVPKGVAPIFGALVRALANGIVAAAGAVAVHYGVANVPHAVIYPPVDPRCQSVARRQSGEVRRVGLVANWNPLKGVEYFVRAAALVRERMGEVEVVFAGARLATHEEYARGVDALITSLGLRPAVKECGFVPSVAPVLAGLDVLVMSSISEAASMPVLEAMGAGVPVVASEVGGVREILAADPKNPAGIIIPSREPEEMAVAILDLLNNPQEADRMGRNGRLLAKERFSLETCVHQHLKVYCGVAKRPARATSVA